MVGIVSIYHRIVHLNCKNYFSILFSLQRIHIGLNGFNLVCREGAFLDDTERKTHKIFANEKKTV